MLSVARRADAETISARPPHASSRGRRRREALSGFGTGSKPTIPARSRPLRVGKRTARGRNLTIATGTRGRPSPRRRKRLPLNVDGAIAAVLCDLAFRRRSRTLFFLSRVAGMVAHIEEERTAKSRCEGSTLRITSYDGAGGGRE